jgi:circadian clock protein KaiC
MPRRKRAPLTPSSEPTTKSLEKCPTGIEGLDLITGGGLPRGRPTLVCGTAGCGKTLLGIEFLVRGAMVYDEPGVFMSFEERAEDLASNVASLGFDLADLQDRKKLAIDFVRVERSEVEETGEYDLDGVFIRLGYAIDSVGAKRVVLDTIESLFGGLQNHGILRAELRRLFGWLKDRGVTAVITGERGEASLTRQGLEEYVSDCVILLDHRVTGQITTRRLRIVKYRGSSHGTNEYPFLIAEDGISLLPITAVGLDYKVSSERISTGVPGLDEMLGGKGVYRGSSILVSGTAGIGKTSLSATFAAATCNRGERCLFFAFEESRDQMLRDMRSIGLDLEPYVQRGLLHFELARPTFFGLEMHLGRMHRRIEQVQPSAVVVDPITSLLAAGASADVQPMLLRLIDFLKQRGLTTFLTSLTSPGNTKEATDVGVSSIVDTWLLLRDIELSGERNRGMYVLKSRGMNHSNQIREFRFTDRGIELAEPYLGPAGVLTGSARLAQESQERLAEGLRRQEIERKQRAVERRSAVLEAQIAAMRAAFETEAAELLSEIRDAQGYETQVQDNRRDMGRSRHASPVSDGTELRGRKPKAER